MTKKTIFALVIAVVCLSVFVSCDKGLKPEKGYLTDTYWSSTDAAFTLIHFKEDGVCALIMRGVTSVYFEGTYKVSGSKVTITNGKYKHSLGFESLVKLTGIDKFNNRPVTLEKIEGDPVIPPGF